MTLLGGTSFKPSDLFAVEPLNRKVSSVDLTIGRMIDENGSDLPEDYKLKPGKMVFVISEEVFALPPNVTGFVSCKTALTHNGVWAITVGIVDPGWTGPVSTTLVNFGKNARLLSRGSSFLRVAFFSHDVDEDETEKQKENPVDPNVAAASYLRAAKHHAVKFPPTFLDQDKLADRAGKKAWSSMRTGALLWGTIIALLIAIVQAGTAAVERNIFPPESSASDRIDRLEQRISEIEGHEAQ